MYLAEFRRPKNDGSFEVIQRFEAQSRKEAERLTNEAKEANPSLSGCFRRIWKLTERPEGRLASVDVTRTFKVAQALSRD